MTRTKSNEFGQFAGALLEDRSVHFEEKQDGMLLLMNVELDRTLW